MPYAIDVLGIPQPAAAMPPATALDGVKGVSPRYALEDHTHAARIQRTAINTAADGTYTWVFSRPIDCTAGTVPPVTYMVEDSGSACIVQITGRAFTTAGGIDTHTSVAIKAQRAQALPNTLVVLSSLISYNIFGSTNTNAIKVNLFVAPPTQ